MSDTFEPTESTIGEDLSGDDGPDKRAIFLSFLSLALIAVFTVFASQNTESVDVDFITWSFSISKILLMVISALAGIIAMALFGLIRRRRSS